jgi:hypothetical protein
MSVKTGSAALSSIDEPASGQPPNNSVQQPPPASPRPRGAYLRDLALRRETAAIRQQTVYGLVMGWVLTLVGGFIFFCVPSRVDRLWAAMLGVGIAHLVAGVVLPQVLAWPERLWIGLARWQGWLVMNVLLTVVYFTLIWPAGYCSRRRTSGFVSWDGQPPEGKTGWQPIDAVETAESADSAESRRSLPMLLLGVIAFFIRRGNYLIVPIIILLLVLGLVLYFVQSSALAPFIYTLF